MYFVMTCIEPENDDGEALMEIHNCIAVGNVWDWRDGLALEQDEQDIPVPIRIDFEPLRGYKGSPVELLDLCVPLMSKRLGEALLETGVDNIDLFPAILENTETGSTYDYYAFKVVGKVAAADLDQSDWRSYDGKPVADTSIEGFTVDDSKTHGLLLFRLAENINALMIHESLRLHIENRGIDTLTFVEPKDWVHL